MELGGGSVWKPPMEGMVGESDRIGTGSFRFKWDVMTPAGKGEATKSRGQMGLMGTGGWDTWWGWCVRWM